MRPFALALPVVEDSQWPLLLIGLCGCILVCLLLATALRAVHDLLSPRTADAAKPKVTDTTAPPAAGREAWTRSRNY